MAKTDEPAADFDEEQEAEAHREYVSILQCAEKSASTNHVQKIDWHSLRGGIVGAGQQFNGPFGVQRLVYADWTASGRAYAPIERYLEREVLPFYANTHTSTSVTGLQSTCFRHEARQIIGQAVNANRSKDVVLFTGSGSTAAVNKLVQVLGLQRPRAADSESGPVVFLGPHEHHSNLLPWRESCADVVCIREDPTTGTIDMVHLGAELRKYAKRPLRIGSFCAASNVTGVLAPVDRVTALLHRHGALACWDYATAAPYLKVDMNPVLPGGEPDRAYVHKDAVFISPHKFLGGVNTPGLLVIKKRLLSNAVPGAPHVGGGTVFYVTDDSHRYLSNRVEREEGGTPDVVGAIRAGLAFQLKQSIGTEVIERREQELWDLAAPILSEHPCIELLGPKYTSQSDIAAATAGPVRRLPIFSFLVRFGMNEARSGSDGFNTTRFLHYNFVSALLNDVFGVQARGGCMCAGPYAQRLLGMSRAAIEAIENELVQHHCEYLRPGVTRFSLPYFVSDEEARYVVKAVLAVAEHGWKMLPLYRFNPKTGEWKHKSRFTKFPERRWLSDLDLFASQTSTQAADTLGVCEYDTMLSTGTALMLGMNARHHGIVPLGDQTALLSCQAAALRWFVFPSEALEQLRGGTVPRDHSDKGGRHVPSIDPKRYWSSLNSELMAEADDHCAAEGACDSGGDSGGAQATMCSLQQSGSQEDVCLSCITPRRAESTKYPLRRANSSSTVVSATPTMTPTLHLNESTPPTETSAKSANVATASTNTLSAGPTAVVNSSASTERAPLCDADMFTAVLRPKIPRKLSKQVGKCIMDWEMIKQGDRLLLGLSGGKDSLCLLHILLALQRKSPVRFELAACTIDPMTEAFDPSPLIPYMASLGVPYHFIQQPIMENAKDNMQGNSICAYCARMKRGALYTCVREHGYTTLVLAQHLDDLAESFLMSIFHNGHLRTMKANYVEKQGDVRIIRPLAYTRELETKQFSYSAKLPVINENCPACFEAPQERKRVKKLLAKEESVMPHLFGNLRTALVPLMSEGAEQFVRCELPPGRRAKKRRVEEGV